MQTHHRRPKKYDHDEILHAVMDQIHDREIWIPYGEIERYYKSKIGKWYRKIESEGEIQKPGNEEDYTYLSRTTNNNWNKITLSISNIDIFGKI